MAYTFGPFRYDAEQKLLFRGAEVVPLVPKVVETLHALLERRGRIVEKNELTQLVWPDTMVEEGGLARNISLLRKALDDQAGQGAYIETIPRRGYRFIGAVTVAETPAPAALRPRGPVLWLSSR
jgi:eukaryotic-like serine/threonine-protein kinase